MLILAIIGMVLGYGLVIIGMLMLFGSDTYEPHPSWAVLAMLGGILGHISLLVFLIALVHRLFF